MVKYKLINPSINGGFPTTFNAKNPNDAATKIWKKLSANFTNFVPHFAFTFKSGNAFHHYLVKENVSKDLVNYEIDKLNIKNNSKEMKAFTKHLQRGGKDKKKGIGLSKDDDDLKFLMHRIGRGG